MQHLFLLQLRISGQAVLSCPVEWWTVGRPQDKRPKDVWNHFYSHKIHIFNEYCNYHKVAALLLLSSAIYYIIIGVLCVSFEWVSQQPQLSSAIKLRPKDCGCFQWWRTVLLCWLVCGSIMRSRWLAKGTRMGNCT